MRRSYKVTLRTPMEVGQWASESEASLRNTFSSRARLYKHLSELSGLTPIRLMELARTWQRATDKEKAEVREGKITFTQLQRRHQKESDKPRAKYTDALARQYSKRILSDIVGKGENVGMYKRLTFAVKHPSAFRDSGFWDALERIQGVLNTLVPKRLQDV